MAVLRIARVSMSQELQGKDKQHEGTVRTVTDKSNALRVTVQVYILYMIPIYRKCLRGKIFEF